MGGQSQRNIILHLEVCSLSPEKINNYSLNSVFGYRLRNISGTQVAKFSATCVAQLVTNLVSLLFGAGQVV